MADEFDAHIISTFTYIAIVQIIDEIQTLHSAFNEHFFGLRQDKEKFHLKSNRVEHVFCPREKRTINNSLNEYCMSYRDLLSQYDVKLPLQKDIEEIIQNNLDKYTDRNILRMIQSRVKQAPSIQHKWEKYATSEKHRFGNIPLKKCMNDIMGYRFLINDRKSLIPVIEEYIEGKNQLNKNSKIINTIKFHDSTKLDYRASHLYFFEGNFTFPWELQIWDFDDYVTNQQSHAKYKQDYIIQLNDSLEWEL